MVLDTMNNIDKYVNGVISENELDGNTSIFVYTCMEIILADVVIKANIDIEQELIRDWELTDYSCAIYASSNIEGYAYINDYIIKKIKEYKVNNE